MIRTGSTASAAELKTIPDRRISQYLNPMLPDMLAFVPDGSEKGPVFKNMRKEVAIPLPERKLRGAARFDPMEVAFVNASRHPDRLFGGHAGPKDKGDPVFLLMRFEVREL